MNEKKQKPPQERTKMSFKMNKRLFRFLSALALVPLILSACSGAATPAATIEPTSDPVAPIPSGVLVLGDISDDPAEKIEKFQPLADYLAANLSEYGIGSVEIKIAPDLDTMVEWIKSGEVDLYSDSPFPAMYVSDRSGAQPILRRWRKGVEEYHTVIFALKDSGITSVNELNGHTVAFEEPFSTTAYFLPRAYLIQNGLTAVEKPSAEAAVAENEVGYVFTGDDENIVQWVLSGKVSAGAIDNITYAEDIPEETRANLTILLETESLPRHITMVSATLDPELVEAIKTLLVNLDQQPGGAEILEQFEKTAKFDEFPEGLEAALARMRELYALVQGE
jgi:phosphonate transport system substrate-binding protein